MAVNIDQATMDNLNDRKTKLTANLTDAQNAVTASNTKVANLQKQLDSINAIIADCVVVP